MSKRLPKSSLTAVFIFVGCATTQHSDMTRGPASANEASILCSTDTVEIYSVSGKTVTGLKATGSQYSPVVVLSDPIAITMRGGKSTANLIEVRLETSGVTGWVNAAAVAHPEQCQPLNHPQLSGPGNCAQATILKAAKLEVARRWDNRPAGGGQCALGVDFSLRASGVGSIKDGLGNAIDYLAYLPTFGFIKTGIVDPNLAPPGAIIVFGGPDTKTYLKTHRYGRPPGNWVGHVTIKGDDGYFYTDGRTKECAIGWSNGVNVAKERNVAGIFVPGADLVASYQDRCH